METKLITCIGAGYVGGPTMAMIASKCPEHTVTVVDINKEKIQAWNSDCLPIYEPGLDELVRVCRGKNLWFSTNIPAAIETADIIFVSVNTPTKTTGIGAGQAADLQFWESTAREILKHSKSDKIIVEKSTVPVRTAEAMERILKSQDKIHFEIISNPEFLAEGSAIRDLERPDRVLIGGHNTETGRWAVATLAEIYARWVPQKRIITTNLWSAELGKLASNALLAQRISSINALSEFCEATGADITEVARAAGMDSRIGPKFLNPSVGFGGSCFKKDVLNLVHLCKRYGLETIAHYLEQIVKMNEHQKDRFVKKMVNTLFNTVAGKRIAIFGFAFKANTGDTRESPAIDVCRQLFEEGARIVVTDPRALANAKLDLADIADQIVFENDPYRAAKGSHAIAILTEWPLYKKLDYQKIYDSMEKPAFIFDGRNILDHQALYEVGFNVFPIGRPSLSHL